MKRIYDIGANIGKFTESNLKKYPNSEFILLEPNPKIFEFLKKKFINHKNIKIENLALHEESNKDISFYICEAETISTTSIEWIKRSRFNQKYKDPIQVKSITIEDLIKKYGQSDYMKIDIEGSESIALMCLKEPVGLISFEFAEEMKTELLESLKHLKLIGYNNFYISYEDNYSFIPDNFYEYETIAKEILFSFDENRKQKWGMIYIKNDYS